MLLNCSTFQTALTSLCEIFNTTNDKILTILSKVKNDENEDTQVNLDNIYASVVSEVGIPNNDFKVLYFHATRVKDVSSFYKHGILTKKEMYPKLHQLLTFLSSDLVRSGSYVNSSSVVAKSNINDEGPFAFMMKCLAVAAPNSYHNYTQAPELVEDIAGSILGENYHHLVSRFQEHTIPCLVLFTVKPRPKHKEISRALFFLKLFQDGKTDLEAGSIANRFFDSEGVCIPVNRIKGIIEV